MARAARLFLVRHRFFVVRHRFFVVRHRLRHPIWINPISSWRAIATQHGDPAVICPKIAVPHVILLMF